MGLISKEDFLERTGGKIIQEVVEATGFAFRDLSFPYDADGYVLHLLRLEKNNDDGKTSEPIDYVVVFSESAIDLKKPDDNFQENLTAHLQSLARDPNPPRYAYIHKGEFIETNYLKIKMDYGLVQSALPDLTDEELQLVIDESDRFTEPKLELHAKAEQKKRNQEKKEDEGKARHEERADETLQHSAESNAIAEKTAAAANKRANLSLVFSAIAILVSIDVLDLHYISLLTQWILSIVAN